MRNSFWRNIKIGVKLAIGFGILMAIIALSGFVSLYTFQLEDQAFQQFTSFEDAALLAEGAEVQFLIAQNFEQRFFARWHREGYDDAYENYIIPNQVALAAVREQLDLLEIELAVEADEDADVEIVNNIRESLDVYEAQLKELLTDVQNLGFVDFGLEGAFRLSAGTLENIISTQPSLYVAYLQMRRHEKDFITRLDVDDADTTIAFANQLKAQIEASARSTSEIATLTGLVDDYISAFSEYTVLLQRTEITDILIRERVETILSELDEIIADENIEAQAASERFSAIQNTTQFLNITMLVMGLVIGLGTAFVVARTITTDLSELTQTAEEIADGHFERRVEVKSSDEIGELGESFNQMVETIVTRNHDVQAIVDVSGRVATILDENRLLQDVVDLSKERFDLYHAHIYLLNEVGDTLELTAGAGYVGRQMVAEKRIIDLDNPNSIVARTARTRESSIVNNVRASETFLPHPLLPETRSELAVALVARGQVLGVLDVQSDKEGYFNQDILAVMQTLAIQISNALSNTRLFATAQRNSRHAQALSTIQQNMQSASDMDEMLQATAHALAKALRVPYAAIELNMKHVNGNGNNNHLILEAEDGEES